MFVQLASFLGKVFQGTLLELAESDPSVTRLYHLAAHRLLFDFFPDDGDHKGPVFFLAENGQHHFGVRFAAHALDRLIERQAFDRGIVHLGDQVIGFQAGAEGG